MDLIRRGVFEILPEEDLVKKLERSHATQTPLRVKLGCDPSRPDLHIGHSVVLKKLRNFQDLGHEVILIVGDFTGMIGDPSGRNKTRPSLTLEETRVNGQSYFEQATMILSRKNLRMVYNSEWLSPMTFADVIALASKHTVARMLERDDFLKRYRDGLPIGIHEFLYPLAQAMDSVAIRADVELGGTDQKFNLLVGREIQKEYGQEPQVILTMPILPGIDGVEKMSKSLDNYIGITEEARDIYGKTLRIPDALIHQYFELATDVPKERIAEIKRQLEDASVNPRDLKRELARAITAQYKGSDAATAAEAEFDRIFIQKSVPDVINEYRAPSAAMTLAALMSDAGLTVSRSDARRLIEQGAVTIDGEKISDVNAVLPARSPFVLKAGKRKFLKVYLP